VPRVRIAGVPNARQWLRGRGSEIVVGALMLAGVLLAMLILYLVGSSGG
jgi:hypothetical protein